MGNMKVPLKAYSKSTWIAIVIAFVLYAAILIKLIDDPITATVVSVSIILFLMVGQTYKYLNSIGVK